MYGIVNKSIEDLVVTNFGTEKWDIVKAKSGVDVDYFISNEPYDDDITYKLAASIGEELNMEIDDVLSVFGEWWILKTSKEKYGGLMQAGGHSLKEFMLNLPIFHNRVMMIYPKLTPPEFKISHIEAKSVHLHYFSKRLGLKGFVHGLMIGLGKMYDNPVTVELLQSREEGASHEVFKVSWVK